MSAAPSFGLSVEERFADEYAQTFDNFVRHIRGQGFPISDHVIEAAHEKATRTATDAAVARGFRSVNFAPLAKAGVAKGRVKYGY